VNEVFIVVGVNTCDMACDEALLSVEEGVVLKMIDEGVVLDVKSLLRV